MRCAAIFAAIGATLLTFPPAAAPAVELRGGMLRQDYASWWAVGRNYERDWAINAELAFDSLGALVGGRVIPFVGGTLAPGEEMDKLYAGLNWELSGEVAFLRLGIGATVHNGEAENRATFGRRRQFGSSLLFHVPIEAGIRVTERLSVSAYFDHMSNAGTSTFNPGMDTIGARLGWRF